MWASMGVLLHWEALNCLFEKKNLLPPNEWIKMLLYLSNEDDLGMLLKHLDVKVLYLIKISGHDSWKNCFIGTNIIIKKMVHLLLK